MDKLAGTKFIVTVLSIVMAGAMGFTGHLDAIHLCVAMVVPGVLYVGGQALVDSLVSVRAGKPPLLELKP